MCLYHPPLPLYFVKDSSSSPFQRVRATPVENLMPNIAYWTSDPSACGVGSARNLLCHHSDTMGTSPSIVIPDLSWSVAHHCHHCSSLSTRSRQISLIVLYQLCPLRPRTRLILRCVLIFVGACWRMNFHFSGGMFPRYFIFSLPHINAHTRQEKPYYSHHSSSRNAVERLFGVLFRQFIILYLSSRLGHVSYMVTVVK